MFAEILTYLITFIATTGIAVISILTSYQLFQANKKSEFQILLYQQIFLFSFFIYSIWGNMAIRQFIAGTNMPAEIMNKLAFSLPLLGFPFIMASWFMLLKFSFNINSYRFSRTWIYYYFTGFLAVVLIVFILFFKGNFVTPSDPDKFLLRLFVSLNMFFHLLFLLPFLKPGSKEIVTFNKKQMNKCLIIIALSTICYSLVLWFSASMGYIYTSISFLMLFSSSALLPLCMKYFEVLSGKKPINLPLSFQSFCSEFNISKRESEIVIEICAGKTNKAIAETLFITLQTVKDHTHRIYSKTNVKNRVQLANLVMKKAGKTFEAVKSAPE